MTVSKLGGFWAAARAIDPPGRLASDQAHQRRRRFNVSGIDCWDDVVQTHGGVARLLEHLNPISERDQEVVQDASD